MKTQAERNLMYQEVWGVFPDKNVTEQEANYLADLLYDEERLLERDYRYPEHGGRF